MKWSAGSPSSRWLRVHSRKGTVFTPASMPAKSARSTPHALRLGEGAGGGADAASKSPDMLGTASCSCE